ncbi:MAG: uroporphyrinogen-III C-methyltransferase [Nitrospiraceae bacterium]
MTIKRKEPGKVFLVGAGPGDPKLLTLRGKECLEQADVVLYDYLANPALLEYAPSQADRIYVGRRGRGHYSNQSDINRLIVEHARAGRVVVRLKGGDPFVFGRGGEEAEAVAAAGLAFEVVPGVTAAIAVPAYAGIPVTHRTLASALTIVTGHEDAAKGESVLEWPRLATAQGTLVFLMGMVNLPNIVSRLIAEGKAVTTPAAVIRWGTRAAQRTVVGTLADITEKAREARMEPPTVIVIGEVVRLRAQLNWFEQRPLFGRRILVTRAKGQAGEFADLIAASGGEPILCPTIQIAPPETWEPVDRAIRNIAQYHWLIFTSLNGVGPFMDRIQSQGGDARLLAGLRLCCIGPRTAEEATRYGLRADVIPSEYQAEGIIEALTGLGLRDQRVLIPRARVAREILPDQLRAAGASVDVVPVYQTIRPDAQTARLAELFTNQSIDMITFTSSSTVTNFVELFGGREPMRRVVGETQVACIGPITAATAREHGINTTVMPGENTVPALTEAIARHFSLSAESAGV